MSRLEEGIDPRWGLSDLGREQADTTGEALLAALGAFDPDRLLIYTSPFSRTFETAARVASHLGVNLHDDRLHKADALRERYFGGHELRSTQHYATVWAADEHDSASKPDGDGESVEDVAERLRRLINDIETTHKHFNIVLVSHGDALSILAAVLLGTDLRQHRQHGLPNCGFLRIPTDLKPL